MEALKRLAALVVADEKIASLEAEVASLRAENERLRFVAESSFDRGWLESTADRARAAGVIALHPTRPALTLVRGGADHEAVIA